MTTQISSSTPRLGGLDGLRAVAVVLVVVYHLFPSSPLRSGFIGVDVFFVISGFLITSLLLRRRGGSPRRAAGRLLDFWRRRARRLLPALAVVVTVCATAAWLIGGDLLVGMGRQVLGAATFSYNWLAVADRTDYFAATAPELFRNFWSLAVEEQFYVLWPLLLPLVLLIRRAWIRVALLVAVAAVSAGWMAVLVADGLTTRAYFGTDAHAFGLLLGIALALAVDAAPASDRRNRRFAIDALGWLGLVAIVVAALLPETPDARTFPGTLLLATAGALLCVVAGMRPGSRFGRMLDVAPLRWIGDRSYGIYLWHWPVLVLVLTAWQGFGPEGGVPVPAALIALALSLVAAALSYRWVEQPLRRFGFRRSLAALGRRIGGTPAARFTGIAALLIAAVAIGGTTGAIIQAPHTSSAAALIARGEEAVTESTPTPVPTPTPDARTTVPTGEQITAVGDSVMLASAPSLLTAFPGIAVDAEVSRSIWAGPGILERLADADALRPNVVVALGTNGEVDRGVLEQMAQIVGPDRTLVLVNAHAPRDWIPGVNADLADFAATAPNVWLADWDAAISSHEDLLADDGIHPGDAGGEVYADMLEQTFVQVAEDRYLAAHDHPRGGIGRLGPEGSG